MLKKFLSLILLFLLIAPLNKIEAQQLTGLTISPAIIITPQEAGESHPYTLKIYSDTNKTINVSIKLLEKDSNLTETVLDDEISPELLSWFDGMEDQIFVKANLENPYYLNVKIPDYIIGNYNFAIVFEESTPEVVDNENSTETASQVAIPLIFNVLRDGEELFEELNISKYKITPELTFDGKNSFNISLKNEGLGYLIPRGILSVHPVATIGSFSEQDISINQDKRVVLKNGSLDLDLDNNFQQNSIGQYKATLTVVYGLQNDIVTKEIYFWIIPEWLVVAIIIISIVLLGLIIKKRFYNKRK